MEAYDTRQEATMKHSQGITLGQWWLLRLWTEEMVSRHVSDEHRGAVVSVLGRCFGCAKELTAEERQTAEGLCRCCRRGQKWARN